MGQKKREIGTGIGTFDVVDFDPSQGGFVSFTVANDFAFPNEDIRRGSIRWMTFDLAKTGLRPEDQRRDFSERSDAERARVRGEKNIDDRFRSLMLTQISPRAFRIVDAAAANARLQLPPIFLEFSRNRPYGSLIRVLIWLPIKPNIPLDRDF